MVASLVAITMLALAAGPGPPPDPTVGIGRVTEFLLPLGPFTPRVFYPEGKVADTAARQALNLAVEAATGQDVSAWIAAELRPVHRIGIQADCSWPPVSMVLMDVLIDELVRAGIGPGQIYVYAADDHDIYRSGLLVRKEGGGVRVLGTASEGFRKGLSRVALDYCDVLINLARLKPHKGFGLWGCLANNLSLVDYPDREEALANPERLLDIAGRATVRAKMKLAILDAFQPPYEPPGERDRDELPPRWPYGGVIASRDPVAADIVGWRLIEAYRAAHGLQPSQLSPRPEYLEKACGDLGLSRAMAAGPPVVVKGHQADALVH
jgi:hypothetical protein